MKDLLEKEKALENNQGIIYQIALANYKHLGVELEDLVQEIMLLVWQKLDLYDINRGSLSTYIYLIAKSFCIQQNQSKYSNKFKDRRTVLLYSIMNNNLYNKSDANTIEIEDKKVKNSADEIKELFIEEIQKKCSTIFHEYYFLQMTQEEIGKKHHISHQRVSVIVKREIEKFKKEWLGVANFN